MASLNATTIEPKRQVQFRPPTTTTRALAADDEPNVAHVHSESIIADAQAIFALSSMLENPYAYDLDTLGDNSESTASFRTLQESSHPSSVASGHNSVVDAFLSDENGIPLLSTNNGIRRYRSITTKPTASSRPPTAKGPPVGGPLKLTRIRSAPTAGGATTTPPISAPFPFSRRRSSFNAANNDTTPRTLETTLTTTTTTTITIPLATFIDLIDRHPSLSRAQILTVEIHRESSSPFGVGVLHRYLIMHLKSTTTTSGTARKRDDIWVRLDRRASPSSILPKMFALPLKSHRKASALSVVDSITLASSKLDLLSANTQQTSDDPASLSTAKTSGPSKAKDKPENRLVFSEPSTLRAFRFFVGIISDELTEYTVWPENSYQLITLLQEYLASASRSQFIAGGPLYFGLPKDVRARIYARVYNVPRGTAMTQLMQCVSLPKNSYWKETFLPKALILAKQFDAYSLTITGPALSPTSSPPPGTSRSKLPGSTTPPSNGSSPSITPPHTPKLIRSQSYRSRLPDALVIDTVEALRVLATQALDPNEGCLLASRAAALYRGLCFRPSSSSSRDKGIVGSSTMANMITGDIPTPHPDHIERFIASLHTHADRLLAVTTPSTASSASSMSSSASPPPSGPAPSVRDADAADVLREIVHLHLHPYERRAAGYGTPALIGGSHTKLANSVRAWGKVVTRVGAAAASGGGTRDCPAFELGKDRRAGMDGIGGAFGDFMRTYRALYLSDTEKWHKELDVAVGLCVDGILKGALQILQQPQTFPSGASSSSRSPTSHALANQTIRDALAASASLVELYRPPSPLDDHAPTRATWTSHWSPFVVAMGAHVERLFRVLGSTPASPSTPYSRPSHRLRTVSGSSIGKGVVGAGTPPHRLISRPSMTSSAGGSGSGSPGSMFTFHSVQHVPAGSTSMSSSVGAGSAASSATEAIDTLATLMRTYRTLWKAQPSPSNSSTALASSSTTSYFPSFKSSRPPFTSSPSASSSSTSTKIPRNLLASSLEALSARLFRVRRPTEACAALNEIVDMYRSSYARDPMNHHVSLAEALAGWGDGLSTAANTSSSASGSMAKWMEACKASEEVVEMYRRHVARDSKTFHALFAKALEAHSERLKKAAGALAVSGPSSSAPSTSPSQRQSMLTSTHSSKFSSSQSSATTAASLEAKSWACRVEIVDFYRGLDRSADLDPGVYHREIAASLNACADALASSGLVHEACDAALEVVEYYRAVAGNATAHTGVGAGLDELRRALEGYAGRLERAGRVHDAVDAIGEIVGYERERFERHPEAHAVGLAEALDELAWRMARAGRLDEAVAHAREAVRIDREWKTFSVRESEEKKQACFERVFACAWYLVCLARRGRKTGAAMGDSSSAAASLVRGSREFPLPLASPNSTSMPFALPALNASMSTIHIPFASKSMSASISMSMSSSTSTFARPSRGPELSSHSLSTVTPTAHFHVSTPAEYYLEVLSLIGPALETLRALRHIYTLEESLHPERYWMNEEEARLRKLVKDVLSDCAHDGVEIAEEDIDAVARGGGEGEEDQDDQYYQQTEQSHSRSRSLSKTITQSLSRSLSRSRSQSPSRASRSRKVSAPLAGSRGPGPPVTKGPVRAHGLMRTKSSSSAMSTSSQNDSPPLRVRPRRNSSSAASMKTRLGWEINRWRAQKASEARTQPWF